MPGLLDEQHGDPRRIRIRHFNHSIGNSATVSYEVEWPQDQYLPAEYFVATIARDGPLQVDRFPEDHRLPGLVHTAQPDTAMNECQGQDTIGVTSSGKRLPFADPDSPAGVGRRV